MLNSLTTEPSLNRAENEVARLNSKSEPGMSSRVRAFGGAILLKRLERAFGIHRLGSGDFADE